jgi:hypothetical protein
MATVKTPCGMDIEPATATASEEYEGRLHFCSGELPPAVRGGPEQFAAVSESPRHRRPTAVSLRAMARVAASIGRRACTSAGSAHVMSDACSVLRSIRR